jgi:hypothetical protein
VLKAGDRVMPGLGSKEGHRPLGDGSATQHFARVAVQATRHVDGDDGKAITVHSVDNLACQATDRPAESGAEQGIDHQGPVVQQPDRQGLRVPLPCAGRPCCVAFEGLARPEQSNA